MFIEPNGSSPSPDWNSGGSPDLKRSGFDDSKKDQQSGTPRPAAEMHKASYVEAEPNRGAAHQMLSTHMANRGGMVIASLDTGSSGNSTLYAGVDPDGSGEMLAVDCGLSRGKFREALSALGLHHVGAEVSAQQYRELRSQNRGIWFEHLLLTHLHSDHFNEATARFCKEAGITVHVDPAAVAELRKRSAESPTAARLISALDELQSAKLLAPFLPNTTKQIGSWIVHATSALHDVPTNAYSLSYGSLTAFHSGDTGAYTPTMRSLAERAQVMLGDSNYDLSLIDSVKRDPAVNERTKGPLGHMGNHQNADILRAVSRGGHSGNLQAMILLHRSDRSNKPDSQSVCAELKASWDAKSAQRHAPAIRMAERGPRILCALTQDRALILPHRCSTDGFLAMRFGETGLSDILGRDVMPELTRELHSRAETLDQLASAADLRELFQDENATITWRVPGRIAMVHTTGSPERTCSVAPVVISQEGTSGIVRISVKSAELGGAEVMQQLRRTLSKMFRPRHPECPGRLFEIDQSGAITSTVKIAPSLLEDIAKITEMALYNAISRSSSQAEETRVRWSHDGKLALVMTDEVLFERAGLAEVVALYNRKRQRLYIDSFGPRATREFFETDRVTALINRLDELVRSLPVDRKKGPVEWRVVTNPEGRSTIKHSGELLLSKDHMFAIRELIDETLIWG
jgi:phosphoribosyl 1,2-cyclic phosphodiesterase